VAGFKNARVDQDNGSLTLPSSRLPYPLVATTSAISNYTTLLPNIGANLHCHDSVYQRIVNDVINRTGRISTSQSLVGGWPDLFTACAGVGLAAPSNLAITLP
jgi:hypothetical protein